jgi:tRNA (guanine-N7-)-methyltransferase
VTSSAPQVDAREEAGVRPSIVRPDRQFYGRLKARPLRPRQKERLDRLLPSLRIDTHSACPAGLSGLFAPGTGEIWLEIGFGGGEHLAWQGERNPRVGFIGVEPFINGVSALLGHIEERGLTNIRICDCEAAVLLDWLPPASISRAFILFPDPWPKARHRKRRLLSPLTLTRLARVMAPGAGLRVATDIGDYAATTLQALRSSPEFHWPVTSPRDWRDRPGDWPETRYEAKARMAGRRRYYFGFVRL